MNEPDAEIRALAGQISALQQKAKALGVFANDRNLVACPSCGLMEDVTSAGLLITSREPDLGQDTGLRFEEITEQTFRCPACGQVVHEPQSEDVQNGSFPA